jgi:hypothetical protein
MHRGAALTSHIDHFFAAADANKDGKLTKDEVANFFWTRISKAAPKDAHAVTKEQLVAYVKHHIAERMDALRHGGRGAHAHRPHDKTKPAAEKSKKESAPSKSKAKPQEKTETKSEPKAQLEKPKELKAGTSAT